MALGIIDCESMNKTYICVFHLDRSNSRVATQWYLAFLIILFYVVLLVVSSILKLKQKFFVALPQAYSYDGKISFSVYPGSAIKRIQFSESVLFSFIWKHRSSTRITHNPLIFFFHYFSGHKSCGRCIRFRCSCNQSKQWAIDQKRNIFPEI